MQEFSSHQARKGHRPCAEKKVSMVGYQSPSIAEPFSSPEREALSESPRNRSGSGRILVTLYSPDHDVVQNTGCVKTG